MKKVVRDYGAAIVTMIAATILFVYLFTGEGGLQITKRLAALSEANQMTSGQHDKLEEILGRDKPNINYRFYEEDGSHTVIRAGESIALEHCFCAVSVDGDELVPEIKGVCQEDGTTLEVTKNGKVVFPESGIYIVEVSATDREGVSRDVKIQIPVQRAERGAQEREAGSMGNRSWDHSYLCDADCTDAAWSAGSGD